MITRRQSTQLAPEPKVRFYKIIALSFLGLTIILLGVVIFTTSKKAEITVLAKEDKKDLKIALHVGNAKASDTIIGNVTSTVIVFSEKYQPQGKKTADSVAVGTVTIFNKSNAPQPLVKVTRLLSPSGVLFHLAERVLVPAGGQVAASVYADQPGKDYEIGPSAFTIPGLNVEKQKLVYAQSSAPMVGGIKTVGVLSQNDIDAASEANKQKVKELAVSKFGNNVVTEVADFSARQDRQVGDEISEFTQSGTSTVVIVSYQADDLKAAVEGQMSKNLDSGLEKILEIVSEPVVSVASYNLRDGTADISVDENVLVTVDANADKLLPQNFLGLSKDDIERYVLGLSHVSGVTVNFSPAWMMSAPSAPDQIKVMVKNVE